jgi:hypothetical protein
MLPGAVLTLLSLASSAQAGLLAQSPVAGAGGASVGAAQVVWSYDTGG